MGHPAMLYGNPTDLEFFRLALHIFFQQWPRCTFAACRVVVYVIISDYVLNTPKVPRICI